MSDPSEYVVEMLVVVKADSRTDAEALGERAAAMAMRAASPRGSRSNIVNVIVSDVRSDEDDLPAGGAGAGDAA